MSSFSQEVFANYPRRLQVLELLLPYLNTDEAAEFYLAYEDCRELIERQSLSQNFKEALWRYDRHHVTLRSYNYRNRQPETLVCQAAFEGHLPAVIWGWDHYPEQARSQRVAIIIMQHAIRANRLEVVKFLLEEGCSYDRSMALQQCNDPVFLLLQQHISQAQVDQELTQEDFQNIFDHAVRRGRDLEVLQYLLEQGVEVTKGHLLAATEAEPLRLFAFLWEHFDSSTFQVSDYESLFSDIYPDAYPKEAVRIFKYLLEILPEEYAPSCWPRALGVALEWGNSELVHLLLNKGVRLREPGGGDYSWIDMAASEGNLELVKFIAANPSLIYSPVTSSTLSSAAISGNLDLVLWLLEHYGKLFHQQEYEDAMGNAACYCVEGAYSMAELMLSQGARNYEECLEVCAEGGDHKIAQLLLERVLEENVTIDYCDLTEHAALHNNPEVLALLLPLGAEEINMVSLMRWGYHKVKTLKLIMERCGNTIDYCREIGQLALRGELSLSLDVIRLLQKPQPDRLEFFVECLLDVNREHPDFVLVASLVEDLLSRGAQVFLRELSKVKDAELATIFFRALLKQGSTALELAEELLAIYEKPPPDEEPGFYSGGGYFGDNTLGGTEYLYQVLLEQIEDRNTIIEVVRLLLRDERSSTERIIRMLRRSHLDILTLVLEAI